MSKRTNEHGHPIGAEVPNWNPPTRPLAAPLTGRWCTVTPLDPDEHAEELFESYSEDQGGAMWTYLAYGPFTSAKDYCAWMKSMQASVDCMFFAIRDTELDRLTGVASYLRIDPSMGSIEIGHISYSPLLQRTRAGTEAMYLLMKHIFEQGYRRYEWKCDSLNAPSQRAAERYGFKYEGIFRQAVVYKGRNRDTAWLSLIDSEWPAVRARFERWLEPANFDSEGKQRASL